MRPDRLIWRSLGMLPAVRGSIAALFVVGVIASALPYVSGRGLRAHDAGRRRRGHERKPQRGMGYAGPAGRPRRRSASDVAGSVPFAVLLAVWAVVAGADPADVPGQRLGGTKVERVLVTDIRQRVHDHLQTLSLDFFTASRSGALMQRVTAESAGVQRLLTDCLLPPLIDTVVLLVAVCYLVALSWQMTVAALVLTPLALLVLRYAGRYVQAAVRRTMDADRAMGAELEQTVSGIAEIQMFNAQPLRSKRFRDVSDDAAKSEASTVMWMQATANGSQVFVALSTVVVLLVGIGFSSSFGLTFAGLMVFAGMVPTMFGAAQRVMGAYTTYQSVAPSAASTYELLDTRPTVRERPDAVALGEVHGNLVFEDVAFGYAPSRRCSTGCRSRSRGRDGGTGRRHRLGQVDGVQPAAALPRPAAGPDPARRPRRSTR